MDLLARSGDPLPDEFANLDALTPFGALYRYDVFDAESSLDRRRVRDMLRSLRNWVESRLEVRL